MTDPAAGLREARRHLVQASIYLAHDRFADVHDEIEAALALLAAPDEPVAGLDGLVRVLAQYETVDVDGEPTILFAGTAEALAARLREDVPGDKG